MSKTIPRIDPCSFCGRPRSEVAWLFKSKIGGLPAAICDDCVDTFADALKAHDVEKAKSVTEVTAIMGEAPAS